MRNPIQFVFRILAGVIYLAAAVFIVYSFISSENFLKIGALVVGTFLLLISVGFFFNKIGVAYGSALLFAVLYLLLYIFIAISLSIVGFGAFVEDEMDLVYYSVAAFIILLLDVIAFFNLSGSPGAVVRRTPKPASNCFTPLILYVIRIAMTIAVIFMWDAEFPDRNFDMVVRTLVTDSIILLALYFFMFLFVGLYTYFTFSHNGVEAAPVLRAPVVPLPNAGQQIRVSTQQSQSRLGGNLIESKGLCGFCGRQNEGQNRFCRFCGRPLSK